MIERGTEKNAGSKVDFLAAANGYAAGRIACGAEEDGNVREARGHLNRDAGCGENPRAREIPGQRFTRRTGNRPARGRHRRRIYRHAIRTFRTETPGGERHLFSRTPDDWREDP